MKLLGSGIRNQVNFEIYEVEDDEKTFFKLFKNNAGLLNEIASLNVDKNSRKNISKNFALIMDSTATLN